MARLMWGDSLKITETASTNNYDYFTDDTTIEIKILHTPSNNFMFDALVTVR